MLPLVVMPGAGSELYRGIGSVVRGWPDRLHDFHSIPDAFTVLAGALVEAGCCGEAQALSGPLVDARASRGGRESSKEPSQLLRGLAGGERTEGGRVIQRKPPLGLQSNLGEFWYDQLAGPR